MHNLGITLLFSPVDNNPIPPITSLDNFLNNFVIFTLTHPVINLCITLGRISCRFLEDAHPLHYVSFVDKLGNLWINPPVFAKVSNPSRPFSVDNANHDLCFLTQEKQEPVDKSRIEL